MLRPVQGSCGWEWAFEGKPNCFCTVGATESVSVNKAGMCWHITRGRGRSRQCRVAPQECKVLPQLLYNKGEARSRSREHASPFLRTILCKQKTTSVSLRRRSFYGRGWITQAAHLKKPRRGFFPRRTVRRVDAVRIHPPSLREGYYKTETPVPGSDTGVLGGRGWIRTTEAEKQQIYSLSPLATREHAQILFTSVAGRLVYFIRLRAICQLLFSDFCSFSAEAVDRISFGSDVSGARNPARRQWLRRT